MQRISDVCRVLGRSLLSHEQELYNKNVNNALLSKCYFGKDHAGNLEVRDFNPEEHVYNKSVEGYITITKLNK